MGSEKPFWMSKTLWGAVALVAVGVGQAAGYSLGEAPGWAEAVVSVLAGVWTLIGRAKAVKKITL